MKRYVTAELKPSFFSGGDRAVRCEELTAEEAMDWYKKAPVKQAKNCLQPGDECLVVSISDAFLASVLNKEADLDFRQAQFYLITIPVVCLS